MWRTRETKVFASHNPILRYEDTRREIWLSRSNHTHRPKANLQPEEGLDDWIPFRLYLGSQTVKIVSANKLELKS